MGLSDFDNISIIQGNLALPLSPLLLSLPIARDVVRNKNEVVKTSYFNHMVKRKTMATALQHFEKIDIKV